MESLLFGGRDTVANCRCAIAGPSAAAANCETKVCWMLCLGDYSSLLMVLGAETGFGASLRTSRRKFIIALEAIIFYFVLDIRFLICAILSIVCNMSSCLTGLAIVRLWG